MSKVTDFVRSVCFYVFDLGEWLWREYPARSLTVLTSAVVFLSAKVGIVLPSLSVAHAIEMIVPVLIGGELIHRRVTPAR